MAMQTKVGSFTLNTSTGNQSITGLGFTPQWVMFLTAWPSCDLSTATDVVTASTPGVAQIYVAAASGSVTVTTII